jgi:rod shape-determining protein MreC
VLAVLNGTGNGKPLSADLVPSNTPLTAGEVMVTSGLQGALFPQGIPVARVVSSHTGDTATQESVSLAPESDLPHLRYVSVVLWGPSA